MAQAETIAEFLHHTVAARGKEPALGFIRSGELHWRTWQQVADESQELAAKLRVAGIEPGDRVAQVSENRYEWIITDLAIHLAGAVHVPIHVTLSGEQIAAQVTDSNALVVFVSSEELLAKFADRLPTEILIQIHNKPSELRGLSRRSSQLKATMGINPAAHKTSSPLATILYTSGTTGRPRGVMLSHANLAANAAAVADGYCLGHDIARLCILPLSHIYARTCDLYTWVYHGSRLVLAESRETLHRDCQLVRPNYLSAVPFVYQRIADVVRASDAPDKSAALRNFFGGRIEWLSSGGAPLAPDVEQWFADHGMTILPGYGLTEASPVITLSTPTRHRFGSVGPPLSNVEVRLAEDGEILARGPSIMLGYANDEAATAEMLKDGLLHTGDLGEIDANGFVYIRGRKKELIVLSTGKKVLPTRVEGLLNASPHIEQAAVFGDGQSALVALIVPAARGLARETCAEEINRLLATAAHEEQVRNFAILDRPFSVERGELTPKLSLCRSVIARNFANELENLLPQRTQSSQSK
jgi:long-chain acyl-CoA synthetase